MIGRLVAWSLGNRLLVVLGALLLGAVGVRSFLTLPIDAVPDVTNVQVQVLTNAPGLSPLEIEQLVTRPVELAMAGLPGTAELRSISRAGVSAVTIVFHDDVEIEQARARVSQRLAGAREAIPPSAGRPELGPLTTGLGEVYHFTIAWPGHSAREIRTLLDWEVAYPLRLVPGVVEVNAWGGDTRQVEVRLRPSDLRALGVSPNRIRAIQDGPWRNLLPANGDTPETIQQQRTRVADGLSFARCMRGHGLARFPDPTPQGQLTIEMVRAQGIDVRSPRILRIVTKCLPASHGALTPAKVRQALNEAGG